ncbi:SWIM zinc finger domain-containing protein [Streptomonospora sp. S1-112]|uniref:SWIM zinc finger domain-containing protein n=1 Tax=Streptomonospora mangrovi TaxID=2883123 RepID=A0A9X3SGD2_9ACTN|nr:SWIM zinc finger family protein [Streptomonospora mangrovi]MDA0566772.1 SWIM zinc finger domain-containing protein [Streptomonospora mangrovi]
MSERWTPDDVWALAPDASSRKAAVKTAKPASWALRGFRAGDSGGGLAVWGECSGSGSKPYQVVVDLAAAPASRCSCPSRKFPCKHALALLYLWSENTVDPGDPPEWAAEWLARREAARERPAAEPAAPADPEAAARRLERREERVAEGLAELELWLRDQVESGLAGAPGMGYGELDSVAARLVDAQAGRLADHVRGLSGVTSLPDWPARLLTEYSLLRLLTAAYQRREHLPEPMRATVRARVGLPSSPDLSAPVRDTWHVLGRCDFPAGQVRGRRIWLRGATTGRTAMMVSFAPQGQVPETPVRVGTAVDADLAFHPAESRAVLVALHGDSAAEPPGTGADTALADWSAALAADPWCTAWPVVVADAEFVRGTPWLLADPTGAALPLRQDCCPPLTAAAVSGGAPVTVAGEWTPGGLRPLSVWAPDGRCVSLDPRVPAGAAGA